MKPGAEPVVVVVDAAAEPVSPELADSAANVRAGKLREAERQLDKVLASSTLRPDDRIVAEALFARCAGGLKRAKDADQRYRGVLSSWPKVMPALVAEGLETPDKRQRMARALAAVGEATLHFGDRARSEADKIAFPTYRGLGDQASVRKHAETKIAEWIKKKGAAIDSAEKAYQQIVAIEPLAPPAQTVAAALRIAEMRAAFVADVHKAPMPRTWIGPEPVVGEVTGDEMRGLYEKALIDALEPHRAAIRVAYQGCARTAERYALKTKEAELCRKWVEENDAK